MTRRVNDLTTTVLPLCFQSKVLHWGQVVHRERPPGRDWPYSIHYTAVVRSRNALLGSHRSLTLERARELLGEAYPKLNNTTTCSRCYQYSHRQDLRIIFHHRPMQRPTAIGVRQVCYRGKLTEVTYNICVARLNCIVKRTESVNRNSKEVV